MMNIDRTIEEIGGELRSARELCIILHKAPDGDTLGSSLALFGALNEPGRTIRLYCADPPPALYSFLPYVQRVSDEFVQAPLLVTVDCADLSMTGAAAEAIQGGAPTLVIDHHRSNRGYGTVNWIDDGAAATAELIYLLITRMGLTVTQEIADCLYTGIVTDTGRFSFDYTRPASLRIAADLIDRGAQFTQLCDRIFRKRSLARTRLLGAALQTLVIDEDGRISVMTVTQEMLARCKAAHEDTEAIINYGIEIDGILVAVLLHQVREGEYMVSFRARSARVDRVAQALGGGGHIKASGCTIEGSEQEVFQMAMEAIRAYAYA
jgi:phosphoesterase RecJ-like protein